jgi:peptidoglycan/xylan/chitin deacetylase (PgdA/CDA1 family)
VLRRLGWVGVENIQLTGLPPSQGGLAPWQVRRLVHAGWELDTQGFSHADLVRLGAAVLHHEVAQARSALRRRYHVAVDWFAYPSGDYDATVIAAVKADGYRGATTVIPGWARPGGDPYQLPRLRVLGGTSPAALLSLIASSRSARSEPPSYGS